MSFVIWGNVVSVSGSFREFVRLSVIYRRRLVSRIFRFRCFWRFRFRCFLILLNDKMFFFFLFSDLRF